MLMRAVDVRGAVAGRVCQAGVAVRGGPAASVSPAAARRRLAASQVAVSSRIRSSVTLPQRSVRNWANWFWYGSPATRLRMMTCAAMRWCQTGPR